MRGLTEDLEAFDVVLDDEDVRRLTPHARFGVVAQTTQPVERVQRLASLIRQRFPDAEVRVADTVCAPTKRRQDAALELARLADLVIVIGGARSNNTRELVDTCRAHCARVFHVQTAADLRAEWLVERAWSVSRPAPPRRTGPSTMSRRGCGRLPLAGWRRRLGRE